MKKSSSLDKSDPAAALPSSDPPAVDTKAQEIGAQAAYELYLPKALELTADKLSEYRADPQLAYQNGKHEKKIAGKTAITVEDITEADEVGSKLQTLLKTKGTPADNRPAPDVATAVDHRNRFWTLVDPRHEMMWRIGAWLWGRAVDEHVPPLQSRSIERHRAEPEKVTPQATTVPS